MPTVNKPLNQDFIFQIYAPEYTSFRLLDNGTTIYEGKVYPRPNTDYGNVNITKILENYVNQSLPEYFGTTSTQTSRISQAYNVFGLQRLSTGGTWENYGDIGYLFWFDYDETPANYTNLVMNDKINGHSAPGAHYVITRLSDGHVTNTINASAANAGYDESYCSRYGITYLNRKGGYDFFLFEGKCYKTDEYDIYKYNKTYDNTLNGFGSTRYLNSIAPVYTLNTGWMSDDESYRFAKHVVGSNQVWLQDLETGKTRPVVIRNSSVEYKTFDTQKVFNYTLEVEESQGQIRK